MSTKKHIPPSLRYLKARLSVLAQVEVWGTVLAIGGFLFIAWQYWQNPQWFNAVEEMGPNADLTSPLNPSPTANNNNSLSPDDVAAIGADIDSLPVLMNELNKAGTGANAKKAQNQRANEAQGLFDTMLRRQEESKKAAAPSLLTPPAKEPAQESQTNPFLTPLTLLGNNSSLNTANIGLPTGRSNNSSNSSTSAGSFNNGLNPNNPNNNPPQVSALETAIRNLSNPGNTATNPSSSTPTSNTPQNGPATSLPGTSTSLNATSGSAANSGPNPFTYLTQPNSAPQGYSAPPATSPLALPVTPSTVPVVPPVAVPGVPLTPAASANPNLGAFQPPANSTLNNSALQPSQLGSPTQNPNQFNTRPSPRPYPGRAIGGGQINSFSNPTRN